MRWFGQNNTIFLTPEERIALTILMINTINNTDNKRKTPIYNTILNKLASLRRTELEITDTMALAGAKTLTKAIGLTFEFLPPGHAKPERPKWRHGQHVSASQDDYSDLCRAIIAAGFTASRDVSGATPLICPPTVPTAISYQLETCHD